MNIVIAPEAREQLSKLPKHIQKKAKRQFNFLLQDYRYPSLHSRKMSGLDLFEARIDLKYRFTFEIDGDTINIITIGPHDEGLGRK